MCFEEKIVSYFPENVGNDTIGLLPHTAKRNKKLKGQNKQKMSSKLEDFNLMNVRGS